VPFSSSPILFFLLAPHKPVLKGRLKLVRVGVHAWRLRGVYFWPDTVKLNKMIRPTCTLICRRPVKSRTRTLKSRSRSMMRIGHACMSELINGSMNTCMHFFMHRSMEALLNYLPMHVRAVLMILICCDSYVLDMHRSSISDFSLWCDQRINSCIYQLICTYVGPVIREQQIKLLNNPTSRSRRGSKTSRRRDATRRCIARIK
jgi:hypothetical protein